MRWMHIDYVSEEVEEDMKHWLNRTNNKMGHPITWIIQ